MAQPATDDPYAHLPSQDIDVENLTQEDYQTVMNWMHERNVARADGNTFRDIPVTSDTTGFRRLNLTHAGKPTVSLIIDEKDSYLIAFRRGNGAWLHFKDKTLPEVPGAGGRMRKVRGLPIQLNSSYMGLIKEEERPYFSVGKHSLKHTYHVLLNYDAEVALGTPLMNKQRKALTQLIVMFCEASRFDPIYDSVLETMGTEETRILKVAFWAYIKNWSSLSWFAMHCRDMEADDMALDPLEVERVAEFSVGNGDEVANLLRLILRQ